MALWHRLRLAAVLAALLAASPVRAGYAERPLTVVVAFDAGGSTDVTARLLAPFLARALGPGARVEVVNRPGASGEVGFAAIADAVPDGHTIGFVNTPNVVSLPIERSARYSLARLDPLVNVVDDPGVWTVRADSPFATLADVVAAARARPGAVSVGSTGIGSDDHLAVLMVQGLTGAAFAHRPFPGSAAAHRALTGGAIQVCGQNLGEAVRMRAAEPVRILGVMSQHRWPAAADVPTFAEQGLEVTMNSLRGIAAPRGLPAEVRATLVRALLAALSDPGFRAAADAPETYQPLRVLNSDAFAAELARQDAQLRALWARSPWVDY